MKRRAFLDRILSGFALSTILLSLGCSRKEEVRAGFGNQEPLWELATGKETIEAPLELAHAKDTPALYRDASMGKPDAAYTPKVSGG